MYKKIIIYFADGTTEEYYGDLSVSDKGILSVFLYKERRSVKIPLTQIKKYEVAE